jgi:restriction system protein
MLPLLRFAADGREHNQRDAKDALSRHFNITELTESDRREMLPSGRQTRFDNRIAWANVYLRKAGFLEMAIRSSASFTRDHGCPDYQEMRRDISGEH